MPFPNVSRLALAGLVASLLATHASAQPKQFQPKSNLTLDDLVNAKIIAIDGKPQVEVTVDAYRTERTTVLEPESRIRLDTADGKTLLLKFSGARRKELKNIVTAIIPAGLQQVRFGIDDAKFFRLSGDPVSAAEAGKILTTKRPIFLIDDTVGDPPKLPDLYKQALAPDCLILMTPRKVREIASEQQINSGPPDPEDPKPLKTQDDTGQE